jgi:uncharacterized membrane protein YbhN (UPF0104 family)
MKALSESLALFVPPLWLTAVVAAVAAAALLMAFVSTLQENLQRGESLRQWQRVGTVRQSVGMVATAAPGLAAQQSGERNSAPLHP